MTGPQPIVNQVSAGGVAFRQHEGEIEVALILVGPRQRWQLPKGAANGSESLEEAALREVREETGLETQLFDLIDKIEYWFYASRGPDRDGPRARFHKFVYFYLMRFCGGDVRNHDHEVMEARWFPINSAIEALTFESEKEIVRKARERIVSNALTNTRSTCAGEEAQ